MCTPALSADAGGGGTRLMPRDAYRFARGEQVISNTGQPVKLSRPLDFYMITDHSDGMGAITDIIGGAPNSWPTEQGRTFHEAFCRREEAPCAARGADRRLRAGRDHPALNYQPGNPAFKRVWDDIIQAAEEFNDPGVFTTFIAFEWTSLVSGNNLHRNVIFRDGPSAPGRWCPTRRRRRSGRPTRAISGRGWKTTKTRPAATSSRSRITAISPTA